jgi:hypothetical protein
MSGLVEQVSCIFSRHIDLKIYVDISSLKNHLQIRGPLSNIEALAKMLSVHMDRTEVSIFFLKNCVFLQKTFLARYMYFSVSLIFSSFIDSL